MVACSKYVLQFVLANELTRPIGYSLNFFSDFDFRIFLRPTKKNQILKTPVFQFSILDSESTLRSQSKSIFHYNIGLVFI